jgi:hypothetical protein
MEPVYIVRFICIILFAALSKPAKWIKGFRCFPSVFRQKRAGYQNTKLLLRGLRATLMI